MKIYLRQHQQQQQQQLMEEGIDSQHEQQQHHPYYNKLMFLNCSHNADLLPILSLHYLWPTKIIAGGSRGYKVSITDCTSLKKPTETKVLFLLRSESQDTKGL